MPWIWAIRGSGWAIRQRQWMRGDCCTPKEAVTVLGPLPPAADVIGRTRIVDLVDKGTDKVRCCIWRRK
jgi:hypothetical protein